MDYYQVLGISNKATHEEIQAAFRKLAKKYHPDTPTGDSQKFQVLYEAYSILIDPVRRAEYDAIRIGTRTKNENSKHRQRDNDQPKWQSYYRSSSGRQSSTQTDRPIPCNVCHGVGKIQDRFLAHWWDVCRKCKGSGAEPQKPKLAEGQLYCHDCGGIGIIRDCILSNWWNTCQRCNGQGIEPASKVTFGETPCGNCGGAGKIPNNYIPNHYNRCPICEGSGKELQKASLRPGETHCSQCKGYGKIWLGTLIGRLNRCRKCDGTGIEPRGYAFR